MIALRDGARYVYLESITGGAYMEDQVDIEAYDNAWARLRAMALDFDRSARMIRRIAAEHRSAPDDEQGDP